VTDKIFISANQLLEDSFHLGGQILDSGFRPDLVVGIWRGGTPVAIAVHELLARAGVETDHIPVRTQLYSGVDQRKTSVEISGLEYIAQRKSQFNKLLLVDDVFDTGQTMAALRNKLSTLLNTAPTEIRIATSWYKPKRNKTRLIPDYFIHTTESWLVFPHELCGIDKEELLAHKPGIGRINKYI